MIEVNYNDYKRILEENMKLIPENHKLKEEVERLTKQNKALNEMYELTKKEYIRLNNIIKEVREYIEEKEEILLNCDGEWLDHDEMIDKKRFKKILEILDKDSDKE